jgi:hypothetical protein
MSYNYRTLISYLDEVELTDEDLEAMCKHSTGPLLEALESLLEKRDELKAEREYDDAPEDYVWDNVGTMVDVHKATASHGERFAR